MKAGFALQLVTVRWLGTFLEDPLDVPGEVLDFVAGQLDIADPSVVKQYAERVKTKSDHQQEIRRKYGLRDFADAEAELAEWVAARAWTSGDGPKAIFLDAMTWLRERKVLLPGVTTLARLVARVREDMTHRLWRELEALLTPGQRRVLDRLLEVPPGLRVSDLERWRKSPGRRAAAARRSSRRWTRWGDPGARSRGTWCEALVPPRRHPDDRRLATLLVTSRYLEAKSVDDACHSAGRCHHSQHRFAAAAVAGVEYGMSGEGAASRTTRVRSPDHRPPHPRLGHRLPVCPWPVPGLGCSGRVPAPRARPASRNHEDLVTPLHQAGREAGCCPIETQRSCR